VVIKDGQEIRVILRVFTRQTLPIGLAGDTLIRTKPIRDTFLVEVVVVVLPDLVSRGTLRSERRVDKTGVVPHFLWKTRIPAFTVVPALSIENSGSPRDRDLEVMSIIRDVIISVHHLGII
jgi:hypothetical protein